MASRKKLLVIGAGDFQLALVKRAAMMCDVLLAAPVIDKPFERYIADALYCDVRDFDRILEFARRANCFGKPIDGVITDETDIPVLTVARVAEAMGLSGIDPDTARLFTNKALMRKRMEELGLKVLPHKTVSSLEEAVAAFKEINSTVIIKPLDAQGSRGVKRCDNAQDIVEHFAEAARWSTTHQVMVEQRATGREFVIEGLALNYEFKNLGIGDTIYFETVESLSAKERTWPTVADDELRDRVLGASPIANSSWMETIFSSSRPPHAVAVPLSPRTLSPLRADLSPKTCSCAWPSAKCRPTTIFDASACSTTPKATMSQPCIPFSTAAISLSTSRWVSSRRFAA